MSNLYEHAFRHVLYPAYESGIMRRRTLRYLREYERNQRLPAERIEALQWAKLQRLLAHCWDNVPYYRERWQALGIEDPQDIRSREDYARLPALTKAEIRANASRLVSRVHAGDLLYKTTGGSTGEPLQFGYTRESYERRVAVMHRGYGWSGARFGERTLYLWGMPARPPWKERLYHAAFNRRMLNAFEMDDRIIAAYAAEIARFRPRTIIGYVAPVLRMAQQLMERPLDFTPPARVLTAAETLHPWQRDFISKAFRCEVYNTYGCREFMLIAAECREHALHTTADHLLVELGTTIDDKRDSPREIMVTDLHNWGMPLLRYVNGDLARRRRGVCSCGLGLPMLRSVDGRKLDALRTVDGRYVPGEFIAHTFNLAKGVVRFQAVQKTLDRIQVYAVRGDGFDQGAWDAVRTELQRVVGPATTLAFEFTEEIPLTATGKHRVTVSELA